MATHRSKTRTKRRFGIVAAFAVGLMVLSGSVFGPPVDAAITLKPKTKTAISKNADVVSTCTFQATRVTNNFVRFTLTASARPADLDGYRANVWTKVNCYVLPEGDTDPANAFITHTHSVNAPSMYNKRLKSSVPYFNAYTLCGNAEVKKKNGDTSTTDLVCK